MDPHTYPESTVLKNLRDIRDPSDLARFETSAVERRLWELAAYGEPLGRFDAKHLQAIHGYLFQDVYAWAGQFRTIEMSKSSQFYFAFKEQIEPALAKTFTQLGQERQPRGISADQFAERGAYYLGEVNAIHPFRDGNGRTQREFFRQLALTNELRLDWSKIDPHLMNAASRQSFVMGNNAGLEIAFRSALGLDRDRDPGRDNDHDRDDR